MRGSVFEIHISIHGFDRCEGVKAVKASEGIYFPLFDYYILNYYLFPLVNYIFMFIKLVSLLCLHTLHISWSVGVKVSSHKCMRGLSHHYG